MADWGLAPDGKTLVWQGSGGAPLLSGPQQVAMRSQLASAPRVGTSGGGGMVPASPVTVQQQGVPRVPTSVPANQPAGGSGNAAYFGKGGALVPGVSMVNGMPTAQNTSFAGANDTIVTWPDGHKTVLMANGLSVNVPGGGGEGGSGGSGAAAHKPAAAPATVNTTPTKVLGPQTAKQLLPAFSPPAMNQFPNFYDPGAYAPVAGSSDIPAGFTGRTVPDIGGQSSIASILGNPWSAKTLDLQPGQNGFGMPAGNDLKNNFVDPRTYGYIAPIMDQAFYQNARSSAK